MWACPKKTVKKGSCIDLFLATLEGPHSITGVMGPTAQQTASWRRRQLLHASSLVGHFGLLHGQFLLLICYCPEHVIFGCFPILTVPCPVRCFFWKEVRKTTKRPGFLILIENQKRKLRSGPPNPGKKTSI